MNADHSTPWMAGDDYRTGSGKSARFLEAKPDTAARSSWAPTFGADKRLTKS
ncbi:hypothetical protein GJ744_008338 [Endocarpon pusillum]|uniref:Uncharacterized protein n=1 Tax=Endocarpon pusillum TaxID=364733 RepID=A0A8H7E6X5_9EURO|nr:hypothetical protein GJ744_008338 [Endocarpon pusillum]